MRRSLKWAISALSALAIFGTTAAADAGQLSPDVGSAGHVHHYPDLFQQAGYSQQQVNIKINAAWNQLFHGAPGSDPTHQDGQTIYYQMSPDMAYVEDIGNQDVRTEGMGYAMMISVQRRRCGCRVVRLSTTSSGTPTPTATSSTPAWHPTATSGSRRR